jgi:hypothetical protein
MAFNLKYLVTIHDGKKGVVPSEHRYYNYDNTSDANLQAEGYFDITTGILAGDQITIYSQNYTQAKTGYFSLVNGKLDLTLR